MENCHSRIHSVEIQPQKPDSRESCYKLLTWHQLLGSLGSLPVSSQSDSPVPVKFKDTSFSWKCFCCMEAFYLTLKKNYYHPLLSLRTTNVMCVYCDNRTSQKRLMIILQTHSQPSHWRFTSSHLTKFSYDFQTHLTLSTCIIRSSAKNDDSTF